MADRGKGEVEAHHHRLLSRGHVIESMPGFLRQVRVRWKSRMRLFDELPEDSNNRHVTEREDQRPQIGNAKQIYDGVGQP
jgi:hypothetical protein